MAIIGDIDWYRGDSFPIELTIKDKETSAAINITGYSFKMTVNTEKAPVDASAQLFQVNGVVDPDQVTNTGKVVFTPSVIDTDQTEGKYFYDIEMTDVDSNVRTIAKFKFNIAQDITK